MKLGSAALLFVVTIYSVVGYGEIGRKKFIGTAVVGSVLAGSRPLIAQDVVQGEVAVIGASGAFLPM